MPHILVLQFLNLLMGGGCYLVAVTSFGVWSSAGWSALATGASMMAANLAYGGLVGTGGRFADGWGRARTAITGAALALVGALIAIVGASAWSAVLGTVICFGGSALFFPGNAGLFSDARSALGEVPLHRKVSRYNLGWSSGNLVGFGLAWILADGPVGRGYWFAAGGFVLIAAVMWQWWSLPAQAPSAAGDRADHPALKLLTRMGRVGLLLYCLAGMALMSLLESALAQQLAPAAAHRLATGALMAYAAGYFCGFMVLGQWSGWVMRPWRLWAIALGMLVAAAGFIVCGLAAQLSVAPLAACAAVLGLAFSAVYTASLYYSLRLPQGAAQAAGRHETFLGVGATLGPLLCGAFISGWSNMLAGLGVYIAIGALLVLGWQVSQIPAITRLLRAHPP
jgi:MFS family permease